MDDGKYRGDERSPFRDRDPHKDKRFNAVLTCAIKQRQSDMTDKKCEMKTSESDNASDDLATGKTRGSAIQAWRDWESVRQEAA
jgi:hypothetical protein